MTNLQQKSTLLLLAGCFLVGPLFPQEDKTSENSQTAVAIQESAEEVVSTEEAAQSETKDETQEGKAETEAQDIFQATDRPPRKELDIQDSI